MAPTLPGALDSSESEGDSPALLWQKPESPCVVKNTFLHFCDQAFSGDDHYHIHRREVSEPPLRSCREPPVWKARSGGALGEPRQSPLAALGHGVLSPGGGAAPGAAPWPLAAAVPPVQCLSLGLKAEIGGRLLGQDSQAPARSPKAHRGARRRASGGAGCNAGGGAGRGWWQPAPAAGACEAEPQEDPAAVVLHPAPGQPECDALETAEAKGAREKKSRPPAERKEWSTDVTTVMIRQLPRQFTQVMLFEELTRRGFGHAFDFLYLPFDTKKGSNVGYGFVNFLQPGHVELFRREFDGTHMDGVVCQRDKLIHVHPASMQGYEANHEYFSQTKTLQKQDPQYSPLFLPGGFPGGAADRCGPEAAAPEGPRAEEWRPAPGALLAP